MAKITQVHLSGKIDNLVFFPRNGKMYSRRQAEKVQLTAATIQSARTFGKAVSIARCLREGLVPAIPAFKGKQAEYLLNEAVGKTLPDLLSAPGAAQNNPSPLDALEFNKKTRLAERLKVCMQTDWSQPGLVTLTMPALNPAKDIRAPAGTQRLHFKIAISGSYVAKPTNTDDYTTAFDLDYTDTALPALPIALPFAVEPGSINAIVVSMQYTVLKKGQLKRNAKLNWLPSAVVGAWYQPA